MTPYIPAVNGGKNFYYEFSLLDYDGVPIIFLSTDDDRKIYLCECTDTRFGEQNWTIVPTDYDTVVRLASRQISLYDDIRSSEEKVFLAFYDIDSERFDQKIVSFSELKDENLPEVEAKIWLTNATAIDDIRELFMKHSLSLSFDSFFTASVTSERLAKLTLSKKTVSRSDIQSRCFVSSSLSDDFSMNMNGVEAA